MQAAGSRAAAGTSSPHVARLAVRARPAGGPAAAEARDYCAGVLRDLGFAINEHSFQYSAFPGSWAAPLAGAAASLAGIGLFVGRHARGVTAATIALAVAAFALLHALGTRGVLSFPAMRRAGVNLEAVRGVGEPRVWLVAHVDSKRQPVSMVARIAGVVVVAIGAAALVALNVVTLHTDSVAAALLIIVWLGSVPLMLSIVWDGGPGALDNASGVATVLEAAANIAPGPAIGVLITDAEELALAGARAWARDGGRSRAPAIALNCDSVDDDGRVTVMYSNPSPPELVAAARRAASATGESIRVIRLLPGVLTDSVALAEAGWNTVTLSRGSLRTLWRIHTSRDSLNALRGTGVGATARVLAAMFMELS